MPTILNAASITHPGQVRQSNEDSIFSFVRPPEQGNPLGLLIVADGMGGHLAGEVASRLAIETIQKEMQPLFAVSSDGAATKPLTMLEEHLRTAIEKANAIIHQYSLQHPDEAANLGSTVTCAVVRGEAVVVANVGDSRVYHLHQNELTQITEDHSYVARLIKEGQLEPEAIYTHPHRSVIIRALGHEPGVEVDVWTLEFGIGDRLLLCSDGLWEMVRDDQIKQRLTNSPQLQTAAQTLINDANNCGGVDNVSVIVAELISYDNEQ
ncbi:MAG: Stp1/IreP family PP2C-type Ser/Thr phosphatase [Chloroflexi bacterium]|nr:Stp1/IreP family PP2C-type Ser/Thr phosphatase [Chloroflexota bacterium]